MLNKNQINALHNADDNDACRCRNGSTTGSQLFSPQSSVTSPPAVDFTSQVGIDQSTYDDFNRQLDSMWPGHVITRAGYDSAADQLNGRSKPEPEMGVANWNESRNNMASAAFPAESYSDQPMSPLQPAQVFPAHPPPPPPPMPHALLSQAPSTNARSAGGEKETFAPLEVHAPSSENERRTCAVYS